MYFAPQDEKGNRRRRRRRVERGGGGVLQSGWLFRVSWLFLCVIVYTARFPHPSLVSSSSIRFPCSSIWLKMGYSRVPTQPACDCERCLSQHDQLKNIDRRLSTLASLIASLVLNAVLVAYFWFTPARQAPVTAEAAQFLYCKCCKNIISNKHRLSS